MLFNPQASLEVWACGPMKKLLLCSWKKLMHHTGRFCFSFYLKQHQPHPTGLPWISTEYLCCLNSFIWRWSLVGWRSKIKPLDFFKIKTCVIRCNSIGYYTLNEHITGSFLWKTLLGLQSLTLLAWVIRQSRCCQPCAVRNKIVTLWTLVSLLCPQQKKQQPRI